MKNLQALESAIQTCNLHSLEVILCEVLARTGYGDITILDRRHPKQKSRLGGCELLARTRVGNTEVVAVIKIIRDFVRVRMFDELAGVIDRTQADFGIVVSQERTSGEMATKALRYQKAKMQVIDLADLSKLLKDLKIGVRKDGSPDYAYFAELESRLEDFSNRILNGALSR